MIKAKTYAKPAKTYGKPAKIYGEAFLLKEEDQQEVNKYFLREFSKEMEKSLRKTKIIDNPLFWLIIAIIFMLLYICNNIIYIY